MAAVCPPLPEARVKGIPIGQLLVEQGVLSADQVSHILKVQKASHRPFGDLAERLYGIDPQAVENAWVEQYIRTAGVVDLEEVTFDADCLRMVNRRQAWQFHLLPSSRQGEHLNVATDADNLIRAVNFSSRRIDEAVYFLIAEREQLREFLMKHYPVPEHIAQFAEKM
jgi:type II secretion system (T2SS) protein E